MFVRSITNEWGKVKPVVFQSDDWGYCGFVPNKRIYELTKPLLSHRYGEREQFLGGSTLERPEDMERLFSLLERFHDIEGRNPVFQAAYIMANPDCVEMCRNNYQEYIEVALPFVPAQWQRGAFIAHAKKGIETGVWIPIFHGMSHFNIDRWLYLVRTDRTTRDAAANGCVLGEGTIGDFELSNPIPLDKYVKRLQRGIDIFTRVFGYKSDTTVLPAYVWPLRLEVELAFLGIRILEGKNFHTHSQSFVEKIRAKLLNFCGYKDASKVWQITCGDYRPDLDLYYLERNVFFEPLQQGQDCNYNKQDIVRHAINQIERAWAINKPAVITTHRFNYVQIDEMKSAWGLECLKTLLEQLTSIHPDLHFFSDHDLLNCITRKS